MSSLLLSVTLFPIPNCGNQKGLYNQVSLHDHVTCSADCFRNVITAAHVFSFFHIRVILMNDVRDRIHVNVEGCEVERMLSEVGSGKGAYFYSCLVKTL